MYYFSADTHFSHANIIIHCDREFHTLEEMNTTMLDNINEKVGDNDIYWHLGDFAWRDANKFLDAINCKDIRIILGNHDKREKKTLKQAQERGRIRLYHGYHDMKIEDKKVTLCHYPMRSWNCSYHGSWHLSGHVHGMITNPDKWTMDVGVDSNNFFPVSWEEVKKHMDDRYTHIDPELDPGNNI